MTISQRLSIAILAVFSFLVGVGVVQAMPAEALTHSTVAYAYRDKATAQFINSNGVSGAYLRVITMSGKLVRVKFGGIAASARTVCPVNGDFRLTYRLGSGSTVKLGAGRCFAASRTGKYWVGQYRQYWRV